MTTRSSSGGWPQDDRDELSRLAKELFQTHFDVQVNLVRFHIEVADGSSVSDTTYSSVYRAIGRLQRCSIDLHLALVEYRTTGRLPAVREGE